MKSNLPKITLFLGVYNGEQYLESLFEQLRAQDSQKFNLLVIDNSSTDNSYDKISNWKKIFGQRLTLVRNEINYGAYGSLFKNLNRIKTPWFCWLQQDDYYKKNHVSTILELISKSDKLTIGVSTTMGTISNSGTVLNSKPRSTWFSANKDQAGQFLQNLKAQSFPDPSSAYRTEIYKKVVIPVHSTTFPDTEHTLRMLAYGKFMVSRKETMYYRENPNSDSHGLNHNERVVGTFLGLIRVFNSNEFIMMLNLIQSHKRFDFASQLLEALSIRLPEGELLQALEILVLEIMIENWSYNEKNISKILSSKYKKLSANRTINILNNLTTAKGLIKTKQKSHKNIKKNSNINNKIWEAYFKSNNVMVRKYNRQIIMVVYKLLFLVKPKHRLKNRWK
jgi:glycosyltransferase involved in cell wall biosynthesis